MRSHSRFARLGSSGLPAILAYLSVSLLCATARAEVPLNGLTESEKRGGWRLLFDGKTLEGWRNYRKRDVGPGWQVRDGAIVRVADGAGDLITKDQFQWFELALEYRIGPGGNSGVMFWVQETDPAPWMTGPEVQILDNKLGRDPQKAGWLYQLYHPVKPDWARRFERQVGFQSPEIVDATKPAGQWNHLYIRVSKTQGEVCLNGISYYYFVIGDEEWNRRVARSKFARFPRFAKVPRGHICLQDHGDPVAFRNIKIRELPEDGSVPDPVDGELPVRLVQAFPKLRWEGWNPVTEQGKVKPMRPIEMVPAPDDSNRLFVATQSGVIYCFENRQDAPLAHRVLDIRDRVRDFTKENEEGLFGFALHPRFRENGTFYVYYTTDHEPHTSIVSRFRMRRDEPNRADPDSEEIVMRIEQPFANHNGGPLAFGPDGYLYIALGDGGGRNDPLRHGQNLRTLMGSILRIDVDRAEPDKGRNYAIPRDNPFLDRPHARPEIYAYGIRNVWRMGFDEHTGLLWVGDVGQDLWEEIDIIRKGGNYGWSIREGSYAFGNDPTPPEDPPIDPVWEYDHRVGKSITGGYVYRSQRIPELYGAYLYGDFVTNRIWALKYDPATQRVLGNYRIPSIGRPVLAFGRDAAGEVYLLVEHKNGRGIYAFVRTDGRPRGD
ncbi:MAG: DUF1080 domain-containing protein [Planctomycetota bacterium]|nr:MAG: DUF1080 domain-containing protein [Planctomycetota bacterium]